MTTQSAKIESIRRKDATYRDVAESVDMLKDAFVDACVVNGYTDEWDAYRAESNGATWPASLVAAHRAYISKLHEKYELQHGPNGVLGRH